MSLIKNLAGQTAIYGISSILGRVFNYFVLSLYLAKTLDLSNFGEHGFMYTFVAFLLVILGFKMETTLFRFANKTKEPDKVFSTAISFVTGLCLVIGGLIYLFAGNIATLLEHGDTVYYFKILVLVAIFDALALIPFARLRLNNQPKKFAIFKLLNVGINILFVFFFLELAPLIPDFMLNFGWVYDANKQLDYVFWANLIASITIFILFLPQFKFLKFNIDTSLLKKMIQYAFPLVLIGIASVINDFIAIPMIEYFTTGSDQVQKESQGLFNGIAKLAILMNLFIQAFNYAAEPFFFKQAEDKNSGALYSKVALAFTLVGCLIFLIIGLYSDVAILLIGAKFTAGIYILPLLLIANLLLGIYFNIGIWYKLNDQTWYGAKIALVGSAITIISNYILLPILGIQGAAITKLICFTVMVGLAYYYGQKHYPIPYDIKRIFLYILSSVVFYYTVTYILSQFEMSFVPLFATKTIAIIIFAGLFWSIEKNQIKSILK